MRYRAIFTALAVMACGLASFDRVLPDHDFVPVDRLALPLQEADPVARLRRVLAAQRADPTTSIEAMARTTSNLSFRCWEQGRFVAAREAAMEGLELLNPEPETEAARALLRSHLARISESEGLWSEALEWATAAREDLQTAYGHTPMVAEAHEAVARLQTRLGQRRAAIESLEWAIAIYERWMGPFHEQTVRPMVTLAECLEADGRADAALLLRRHALEVLDVAEEGLANLRPILIERQLRSLRRLGEVRAMIDFLEVQSRRRHAGPSVFALDLLLAEAWLSVGEVDRAEELADRAEVGRQRAQASDSPEARVSAELQFRWQLMQAGLLAGRQQYSAAIEACCQLRSRLEGEASAPREALWTVAQLEARILMAEQRWSEAYDRLRPVLEEQRATFGESAPQSLELLLALLECEYRARGTRVETLDYLEMVARCLERVPARQWNEFACDQRSRWGSDWLGSLREIWLAVASERPRFREQAVRALDRLGFMPFRFEATAANRTAGSRDESECELPLLRFFWTNERVWAWWLPADAEPQRLLPLGRIEDFLAVVQRTQQASSDPGSDWNPRELSDLLLSRLAQELRSCSELYLLAEGPLAFLPFEALLLDGRPWLLQAVLHRRADSPRSACPPDFEADPKAVEIRIGSSHCARSEQNSHQWERWERRWSAHPLAALCETSAVSASSLDEAELKAGDRAGELRDRCLVRFEVPLLLDTRVASANGLVLRAGGPATEAAWNRQDGVVNSLEASQLDLQGSRVWFPRTHLLGVESIAIAEYAKGDEAAEGAEARAGVETAACTDSSALHGWLAAMQIAGASEVWFGFRSKKSGLAPASACDRAVQRTSVLSRAEASDAWAAWQRAWWFYALVGGRLSDLHPAIWARHQRFLLDDPPQTTRIPGDPPAAGR